MLKYWPTLSSKNCGTVTKVMWKCSSAFLDFLWHIFSRSNDKKSWKWQNIKGIQFNRTLSKMEIEFKQFGPHLYYLILVVRWLLMGWKRFLNCLPYFSTSSLSSGSALFGAIRTSSSQATAASARRRIPSRANPPPELADWLKTFQVGS